HIEQTHVGPVECNARAKFGSGPANEDVVAFAFQNDLERAADVHFVIDDENTLGHRYVPAPHAIGNTTRNAAPPSSLCTIMISPPLRSALFRAMDRPSPIPRFLNVIVGSNREREASVLKPGPESWTSIKTFPSTTKVTPKTPPAGPAASAAFSRRF